MYKTFNKILNNYTPKEPKTINFYKTNFFVKGNILYVDTKFIYINIGLKTLIKVPKEYCVQLKTKKQFYIQSNDLTRQKLKIIRIMLPETEALLNTTNIKTIENLHFVYWNYL